MGGRLGNYEDSPVELNDFYLIEDLTTADRPERLERIQSFAAEAADHLRHVVRSGLETHTHLLILTHIPPFKGAAWHEGEPSNDDWLPFFSCEAVGDVLTEVAGEHPSANLTVLCGHTHGEGVREVLPNLTVVTGGAVYGRPAIVDLIDIA